MSSDPKYHNNAYEKSTKGGVLWLAIWLTQKENCAEALRLEAKLKNLSKARLITYIIKYEKYIINEKALVFIKNTFEP